MTDKVVRYAGFTVLPHLVCEPHTEPLGVLQCALDILKDDRRWVKKLYERDVLVEGKTPEDPDGIEPGMFCLLGAIEFCVRDPHTELTSRSQIAVREKAAEYLELAILKKTGQVSIVWFNDYPGTLHKDIVSVLTHAIALAQEDKEGSLNGETSAATAQEEDTHHGTRSTGV